MATEARYTASLPTSVAAGDRRHRNCNPVVYAAASVDPARNARGDEDGVVAGGSEAARKGSGGPKRGQHGSESMCGIQRAAAVALAFSPLFSVGEDDERGERTDLTVMPVQIERL
mgnify:CR=1 FL=1